MTTSSHLLIILVNTCSLVFTQTPNTCIEYMCMYSALLKTLLRILSNAHAHGNGNGHSHSHSHSHAHVQHVTCTCPCPWTCTCTCACTCTCTCKRKCPCTYYMHMLYAVMQQGTECGRDTVAKLRQGHTSVRYVADVRMWRTSDKHGF